MVSPELADVLSAVICRVRGTDGAVPLVRARDNHELVWLPPAPLLFQRRTKAENHSLGCGFVARLLDEALAHTGLTDPAGEPLHFTPHDFRRMFITDAVLNGLPPHIAQVIAGHRDIGVTMGYKAVYPDEAITAHLAFIARRRALRPTRNTASPPTRNGSSSSATSSAARFPSAAVAAPSAHHASTNTPVSVAHCSGRTPPSAPD